MLNKLHKNITEFQKDIIGERYLILPEKLMISVNLLYIQFMTQLFITIDKQVDKTLCHFKMTPNNTFVVDKF